MSDDIKVVSKELVFDGHFLKLFKTILALPNKQKRTHFNVDRVPTVAVVPITDDFEVYLIRQYRYLHEKVVTEIVAGTVESGEDPLVCAKRELLEEAGITAKKWKDLGVFDLAGSYVKGQMHMFLAQELTLGKAAPEEDEQITLFRCSLDDAVEKVLQGEITITSSVIGILVVDRLRREGKL